MKIIKRDGRIVDYDKNKIIIAIEKANKEVLPKEKISLDQINKIIEYIESLNKKRMLVEDIQDIIEEKLMEKKKFALAKKYIIYRYTRSLIRKTNTTDSSLLALLKNETMPSGEHLVANRQRDIMAGEASKDLAYRILLPKNVVEYEKKGLIKFCNVEYFTEPVIEESFINIEKMLENGTIINNIKIEKPKGFQSFCNVLVEIIASVSSVQTGNIYVDFSVFFDYYVLALIKRINKYKSFDNLKDSDIDTLAKERTLKEVNSGFQTILYQINTLSMSNGLVPKINFIVDTSKIKNDVEEEIVSMFIKEKHTGIINDKDERIIPLYPKIIYILNDENISGKYEYITNNLLDCKYGFFLIHEKKRNKYLSKIEKFKQGNIAVNLIRIAHEHPEDFVNKLKESLEVCYEGFLCLNHNLQGTYSDKSPIHWQNGVISNLSKGEKIDKYLKSNYSYIGLSILGFETSLKMLKDKVSKKEISDLINKKIKEWNELSNFQIELSNDCNDADIKNIFNHDKKQIKSLEEKDYYDSGSFIESDYLKTEFIYDKYTDLSNIKENVIYYTKE